MQGCSGGSSKTEDHSSSPQLGSAESNTVVEEFASQHNFIATSKTLNHEAWEFFGPVDTYSSLAADKYQGKTELSPLDKDLASFFASTLVTGSAATQSEFPQLISDVDGNAINLLSKATEINKWVDQIAKNSTIEYEAGDENSEKISNRVAQCTNKGSVFLQTNSLIDPITMHEKRTTQVRFDNCGDSVGTAFNGRFLTAVLTDQNSNLLNSYYGFDDLVIENSIYNARMNGAIVNAYQCDSLIPTTRTNLLISEAAGLRQTRFNIQASGASQLNSNGFCVPDLQSTTSISGELFDSEFGMVLLSTPEKFEYTLDPNYHKATNPDKFTELYGSLNTGYIEFQGASTDTARFEWLGSNLKNSDQELRAMLTIGDHEDEKSLLTQTLVQKSIWLNRGDSDRDGIEDGIELYLGNGDPTSTLSDTDEDNDGYSNFIEQQLGSDPAAGSSPQLYPKQTLRVRMDTVYNASTDSMDPTVTLMFNQNSDSQNVESFVSDQIATISLREGTFDPAYVPEACEFNSPTLITCTQHYTQGPQTPTTEAIVFPVSIIKHEFLNSARISLVATLLDRWAVDPDEFFYQGRTEFLFYSDPTMNLTVSGPKKYFVETIGKQTLKASMDPVDLRKNANVDLNIQPSAGILIQSVRFKNSDGELIPGECSLNIPVFCEIPDIKPGDIINVELDFTVDDPLAAHDSLQIELTASSDVRDLNHNSLVLNTEIEIVKSVEPLQALIDTAEVGTTITLPAGKYLGSLDLGYKTLNIEGSASEEKTTLISSDLEKPIFTYTGKRTILKNLVLQTTGAPIVTNPGENLTISDSIIEPVVGLPHSLSRLVDAGESQSYRLKGNLIRYWGFKKDNHCDSLVSEILFSTYITDVYLEQNIFVQNQCTVLFDMTADQSTWINDTIGG